MKELNDWMVNMPFALRRYLSWATLLAMALAATAALQCLGG